MLDGYLSSGRLFSYQPVQIAKDRSLIGVSDNLQHRDTIKEMPALVTCEGNSCEKRWNVASDDFVVPGLLAVAASLFK